MAGTRLLEGSHLESSLVMLDSVSRLLESHGVRYWLEGGTLLGIVREQRLLPWDTDIDISITADQLPALQRCLADIGQAGYRVRTRNHPETTSAFEQNTPRLIKIRNRRLLFFRGHALIDLFVKYKHGDQYFWMIGKPEKPVLKSAPAHFYDTLGVVEFNGKSYPVPADHAGYLEYRYGNWREPVKVWNCFSDDRAIID